MRVTGTFDVVSFIPATVTTEPSITTALPVGVATMEKLYQGDIVGRSSTIFTAAFDQASGTGTYVALESFEGTLDGQVGNFNFVHSASTHGADRMNEFFAIVPSSGTGDFVGIAGTGGLKVEPDGTHIIWFDYRLP